jgi:hypothetical protein
VTNAALARGVATIGACVPGGVVPGEPDVAASAVGSARLGIFSLSRLRRVYLFPFAEDAVYLTFAFVCLPGFEFSISKRYTENG